MAKSRALDKRRKSVRSIRKITRTMELISTAQFRKAMDRANAAHAYTERLVELVHNISHSGVDTSNPLLLDRTKDKSEQDVKLLVLTANRGLCGGYNASVMRLAIQRFHQLQTDYHNIALNVSGKRGIGAFSFRKMPIAQSFTNFQDKPVLEEIDGLAEKYLDAFLSGSIDRLDVCYMKFVSMSKQYPVVETILPLKALTPEGDVESIKDEGKNDLKKAALVAGAKSRTAEGKDKGAGQLGSRKDITFEFLPSKEELIAELLPEAFKAKLFKCFLDAAVGEQIARMVAMKAATENADQMISALTTTYNRARQTQITNEILEIIAGADALEG